MIRLVFWALLAVVIISSCDTPRSARHLFRATNRASQTEQNKLVKPKTDYLISYSHELDSMGKTVFTHKAVRNNFV